MQKMFLDKTSEANWRELLTNAKFDFYHTPEFLEIESKYLKTESVYFYYENNKSQAVIPLLKRAITDLGNHEYFDLISPYGYPGILINSDFEYPKFNDLSKAFLEACAAESYVSAFLRLNPITNNFIFNESDQLKQLVHGNTVYVDLGKTKDIIEKEYSSNHRRNIRKLLKNGFIVMLDDWTLYKEWQDIYRETMKRLYASEYYLYPESYFSELKNAFDDNIHLFTVHDAAGKMAAGGLFTAFNEVIQYHLGGTREEFLNEAPTKLMFDFVIDWGIHQKMKVLHLGGGLGSKEDSLFRFKHGFSPNLFSFSSLRIIAIPEVYQNLSLLRFQDNPDLRAKTNFFPLYRAPIE